MAQHDQVIDNGPGLVVRQDINSAIAALFSTSSGPVEPQVCVAGQLWLDTSVVPNGQLKQRNLTNNGWVAPNVSLGSADLYFGTRLADDRFIWNDQANALGHDIMTLYDDGWLNVGLPNLTTGDLVRVSLTGKIDTVNGDYLSINDKPDGSGNEIIKLRNNGSADFGAKVKARGPSADFTIVPTTGNGHIWWMSADGSAQRMVMYTSGGAQGAGYVALNGKSWTFNANGAFSIGAAYVGTDGNVVGSIWSNWGASDAYSAINARIEARAQAWANAVAASGVTSTRMAGYVEFEHTSGSIGQTATYSAYVVTASRRVNADNYAFGFRQPQVYYPASGWVAAFPF